MLFSSRYDEDTFVFEFWINNLVRGYDNLYYQHRMGMLDDERWEMHAGDIITLVGATVTWARDSQVFARD
jgi:hypothetical protein